MERRDTQPFRAVQQELVRLKDENLSLRAELQQLRNAVHALSRLEYNLDRITPQTDVISLVNGILSAALAAVDSENGSLQLMDEANDELVFVEVQGPNRDTLIGYRLPAKEGVAGWVAENRTPRLVPDTNSDPSFSALVDETIGFRSQSLLCVPMIAGERTLGVIEAVNTRSGRSFSEKDLDILMLVARLASLALARAEGRAC
ncbi:MAG TPA: GAF domain-containing protein [Anaerolineales bacterium]|nr:GAF domain-containing protein [Anaerolineales bacterium]